MKSLFLFFVGLSLYAQQIAPSTPRTVVSDVMRDFSGQVLVGDIALSLNDPQYTFNRRIAVLAGTFSVSLYPGTYSVTIHSSTFNRDRTETWSVPNSGTPVTLLTVGSSSANISNNAAFDNSGNLVVGTTVLPLYNPLKSQLFGDSTALNTPAIPSHPVWSPANSTLGAISQKIYVNLAYFTTDTAAGSFAGADGTSAKPWGSIRYAMTTGCSYTTGAVEVIVTGASSRVATSARAYASKRAVDFVIHPATNAPVQIGGSGSWMLVYVDDIGSTTTGWTGSVEMWGFDYSDSSQNVAVGAAGSAYPQVATYIHHNKIAMALTSGETDLVLLGNTGQSTDLWITDNVISGVDVIVSGQQVKNLVVERNVGTVGNGATQIRDMISIVQFAGQARLEGNTISGSIASSYGFLGIVPDGATAVIMRNNDVYISGATPNYYVCAIWNPDGSATTNTQVFVDNNTIVANYSGTTNHAVLFVGSATTNQSRAYLNAQILAQSYRFSSITVTRNTLINRNATYGAALDIGITATPANVAFNFLKAGASGSAGAGTHILRVFADYSHVFNNVLSGILFLIDGDYIEADHNTVSGGGTAFLGGTPGGTAYESPVGLNVHHNIFSTTANTIGNGGAFTDYAYNGTSYALPRSMNWLVDFNCYFAPNGYIGTINNLTSTTMAQTRGIWAAYGSAPTNDASSINADPAFADTTSEVFSDWIPKSAALRLSNGDYFGAARSQ